MQRLPVTQVTREQLGEHLPHIPTLQHLMPSSVAPKRGVHVPSLTVHVESESQVAIGCESRVLIGLKFIPLSWSLRPC